MPRHDRVVVTAAVGAQFAEMGRITHPLMRAYADKCDAEFFVFSEPLVGMTTGLPGRYEKFQMFDLLKQAERVLFLDTDILVVPGAPNIFDQVPKQSFGMVNEESFSRAPLDKQLTQQVLGSIDWRTPYFNSGVMLAGQAHVELFDPQSILLRAWDTFCSVEPRYHPAGEDQAYLNYRLSASSMDFIDLGHDFNFTGIQKSPQNRFRSFFLHFSGRGGFRYGSRINQIRKDAKVLRAPLAFSLAKYSPRLRWVIDRMDPDFCRYLIQRYVNGDRTA